MGEQLKLKFKVATIGDNKRHSAMDSFVEWKDKKLPKPIQRIPKPGSTKPWVMWGADNCFPLFLNTLYQESPSQNGIINGKCYYLTAGGYTIVLDNPEDNEQKLLADEFEANGPSQFTMSEVMYDNVFDGEMYNGFAIRGVWDETGTRPKFLEHVPFDHIRPTPTESCYYYSRDWSQGNQTFLRTGFREIPRLDFKNKVGEFLIYIAKRGKQTEKYQPNFYPMPPYTGCVKALVTEIEHEAYDMYEVLNGFKTGTLINFPNPDFETEDEQDEFVDAVKEGATDQDAAGGLLVTFSEGQNNTGPTVTSLNGNNLPERYVNVSKKTANTIIRGHSIVMPGLFGIVVEGGIFGQSELATGFEILKKTFVSGRQNWYADIYRWIARNLYGIEGDLQLNPPPPLFGGAEQEDPVGKAITALSPAVANKVLEKMTDNEVRALGKLPPLPGGDVLPTTKQEGSVVLRIDNKESHSKHEQFCSCEHKDEYLARDPVLKEFGKKEKRKPKYGIDRREFVFAKSSAVPVECTAEWFDTSEKELLESIAGEKLFFATLLTEFQKNVLALIDAGEDPVAIKNALTESMGRTVSVQEVMDAYNHLSGKGMVKKNGDLSDIGKKYLNSNEAPIDQFEIRYSYELRPDAPRLIGESRSFCKELIKMDRLYTREEINAIGTAVDREVWNYRGGWYHNPTSDQNTPYCRHYWLQNLVIKRQ